MTARRRRKSGSGPSATALIAWAGGAGIETDRIVSVSHPSGQGSPVSPAPSVRVPLIMRGRGLAAGTLLACGSVLVVGVHTADNSFTPRSAPLPRLATADPHAVSGGTAASLVVTEGWAAAASLSSGQALAGTYSPSGEISHHVRLVWHASGSTSSGATLPLPLDLPGTGETQTPQSVPVDKMVAPVAGVVTPAIALFTQQTVPAQDLVAPDQEVTTPEEQDVASAETEEGTQPAMTMLSPPLLA